jgi:biopolymer transport protein ExbB
MNVVIMNVGQILFKAGPMIWPIILLSILAMTIAINRLLHLWKLEKSFKLQRQILLASLKHGKLKDTLKLCETHDGDVSLIVTSGITQSGGASELGKLAMEEVWAYQQISFKSFMPMLGMIVTVAPLLGLLGTVNAMTVVFHASVMRSNVLNPLSTGELAAGIWQALLTTTAGLMVGIFSYGMHSFLTERMHVYAAWIHHLIAETGYILASLKENRLSEAHVGHNEE